MVAGPEELLAGLDEQQRSAARTLLGPVCILAGAGTGKTRTITHRIAYGVATGAYSPNRVMALTFTSRAAAELRARLRGLGAGGVSARTFHAAALSQFGYFWPQVAGGQSPRILDGKARVIGQASEKLGLRLDSAALRDAAAEIEWRKVSRLTMEQYEREAVGRVLPGELTPERMLDLMTAYEHLKDERREIDFEDVLLATAGMLESEPRVLAQVREQYRFFTVDEYQDVSPLQHDLLQLWLGPRNDVCVVGDASQTIYSFAGASNRYLLGFGSRYPQSTVLRLEQSYRATPPLLEAANTLIGDRPGAVHLRAVDPAVAGPAPTVTEHPDDRAEARAVAASIADRLRKGEAPESIAVLFRVGAQSALLEQALGDQGVPFVTQGQKRFFDLPEVKQAMMLLKGAAMEVRHEPLFQVVSDALRHVGWSQHPPEGRGAERARWDSLDLVMRMAESTREGTSLREFVNELVERQQEQHDPTRPAVTLATLHATKGLEWDSVYLVGLIDGILPIGFATSEAEVEEERRLLYVGITRARRALALSWSRQSLVQLGSARPAQRDASRFLADLGNRTRRAGPSSAG